MMTFYTRTYNWDCYNDRQDDTCYHNWLGLRIGRFFIGIHWVTEVY